jgi:hypothetical protein
MLEKDDKNKQNSIPKIQAVQGRSKDEKTTTEKVRNRCMFDVSLRGKAGEKKITLDK